MARRPKDSPTLLNSLNNELAAGAASTQALPNAPLQDDRSKLGDMVQRLNIQQGRNWSYRGAGTDWSTRTPPPAPPATTQAFNRGKTAAYPVPSTMAMPSSAQSNASPNTTANSNSGQWGVGNPFENRYRVATARESARTQQRNQRQQQNQSPVSLRGQKPRQGGQMGGSLIHSTIRAMELLGDHEGNNKKIIENMVNK